MALKCSLKCYDEIQQFFNNNFILSSRCLTIYPLFPIKRDKPVIQQRDTKKTSRSWTTNLTKENDSWGKIYLNFWFSTFPVFCLDKPFLWATSLKLTYLQKISTDIYIHIYWQWLRLPSRSNGSHAVTQYLTVVQSFKSCNFTEITLFLKFKIQVTTWTFHLIFKTWKKLYNR